MVLGDESFDRLLAQAAADEKEHQCRIVPKRERGVQQRFERVGVAVVAAVHDDEFAVQAVLGAERVVIGRVFSRPTCFSCGQGA